MKDIHEAAEVAAEWWAKEISGYTRHDNGDSSLSGSLAMLLADIGQEAPSEEQVEIFKTAIIKGIEEFRYKPPVCLCSDYGPDGILLDAANEARINALNFPFKTNMIVEPKQVRVSAGYAQPYETIWEKRGGQDDE